MDLGTKRVSRFVGRRFYLRGNFVEIIESYLKWKKKNQIKIASLPV